MSTLAELLDLAARSEIDAECCVVDPAKATFCVKEVCDAYADGFTVMKTWCKNLDEQATSPEVPWSTLVCLVGPEFWLTPRRCVSTLLADYDLKSLFAEKDRQYSALLETCSASSVFKTVSHPDTITYMRLLLDQKVPPTAMVGRLGPVRPQPTLLTDLKTNKLKSWLTSLEEAILDFWRAKRRLVEDAENLFDMVSPLLKKKCVLSRAAMSHIDSTGRLEKFLPPRKSRLSFTAFLVHCLVS